MDSIYFFNLLNVTLLDVQFLIQKNLCLKFEIFSIIFSMYSFVSDCMFPKLASVVATGKMLFKLDMVIIIANDLSFRSWTRPEMTEKVTKIATFVRRDLLAAFLYLSFTSSASSDGISFSFDCECSRF